MLDEILVDSLLGKLEAVEVQVEHELVVEDVEDVGDRITDGVRDPEDIEMEIVGKIEGSEIEGKTEGIEMVDRTDGVEIEGITDGIEIEGTPGSPLEVGINPPEVRLREEVEVATGRLSAEEMIVPGRDDSGGVIEPILEVGITLPGSDVSGGTIDPLLGVGSTPPGRDVSVGRMEGSIEVGSTVSGRDTGGVIEAMLELGKKVPEKDGTRVTENDDTGVMTEPSLEVGKILSEGVDTGVATEPALEVGPTPPKNVDAGVVIELPLEAGAAPPEEVAKGVATEPVPEVAVAVTLPTMTTSKRTM